ncbi:MULTISPECIES: cytidylyltransferase domain-containing protein [Pseudomonas]|jgi:N-acylneuraminate cytidylyltransferase/CMP-N,N'-diacetyllegionaminic acid synthase|uniref:acylneuraminate cytidylyltransferase family protein n=1 Tax=Pseudomonas TaxID=286 RepID=UPI00081BFC9C|nr:MULTISPECIES: acylneuraminate cytidylyltransferase family protein [Pseudomonas]MCP1462642.1 N-acylneuraminate cytidylyltransferase/CMP-N,N'-diacetyllegionaminic acid synthase [Pseudomonas sp. S3E17]OCW23302.1 acylneuraminate cytidylyltransferase [Pseudomonas sp. S3E12]QDG60125.1 acylneuraminate cytidylyltransferase family protein [Pseudomonas sp. NIBRBAC000502773]WGT25486.1 acylneuraminate cytidylyltransferase family protein [Pseudomonas marginalis]
MKILAIVPARGGSKRLPGKNIKVLGGRPLIAWTIEAALQSGVVTDVVISTDDLAIADVARAFGGNVLSMRPAHLATDTAGSFDVVVQVLDEYEAVHGAVEAVMLLQPTSPFRSAESIRRAVVQFQQDVSRSVVSVTAASSHPAWCFRLDGDTMTPFLGWESLSRRSQDLEPAYTLDGSIYLLAPDVLREQKRFVGPGTVPLVMTDSRESLDIDTPEDWDIAVRLLERAST